MKYAVVLLAVVLLAYLVIDFNGRTAELNRLEAEQESVRAQVKNLQETKDALLEQIAYATSEAAVARWAHENHMALEGEYAVVPMQPAQSTPVRIAKPTEAPKQVSNLERWLALFIDPQVEE